MMRPNYIAQSEGHPFAQRYRRADPLAVAVEGSEGRQGTQSHGVAAPERAALLDGNSLTEFNAT